MASHLPFRIAFALIGGLAMTACSFIPELKMPELPTSSQFPDSDERASASSHLSWRQVFKEPCLVRLLDLSLTNNRDLRVAMLRVEQSQAQYRIQRSELVPNVTQTGDFSRTRKSGRTSEQWQLKANIPSYEIDVFGRIRSLSAKALEEYFATVEAQRAAQVSLVAEVARQYYTLKQFEELIDNTKLTLASVEESYRLNESIFKAGGLLELDLRSSEAQVLRTKSILISYQRQREQSENALVLLLGQPLPAHLPAGKSLADTPVKSIAAGVPSDLLLGRPDILEAERYLRAANADIGAARAAFFPSIRLTAFEGTASAELGDLFSSGGGVWSFAPQISVPIFTGGRNQADLDAARIRSSIEIAKYEKAIQTAFREVADALATQRAAKEQITTLQALVTTQQRRNDLAIAANREGVTNYLNVVTAQQDLFSAQQDLIGAHYDAVTARIKIYQSVGGGWK